MTPKDWVLLLVLVVPLYGGVGATFYFVMNTWWTLGRPTGWP